MSTRIASALFLTAIVLPGMALAQSDADAPGTRRPARPVNAATRKPVPSTAKRRATAPASSPLAALPAPPHAKELDPAPASGGPALPVPARPGPERMALHGAIVHTVSGADLSPGVVLVRNGRIEAVGPTSLAVPPDYTRVDLSGRHVYPTLVSADTILGLTEIGAVRATRDHAEVGDINPNARAEVGVNPDSELIPVTRSGGVLVALTAPRGGLIAGTGALLRLDGWTWEDMTLKAPAALFADWPAMRLDRSPSARVPLEKQERERDDRIRRLREAFETARAYTASAEADRVPAKDRDVKWDAMRLALRREIPVVIHADSILEIKAALAFAEEQKVRLILAGGQDAWRVADELARKDVAVLAGNVMNVGRAFEPYDVNFTTPLKLHQAGVRFCIVQPSEASNARNLPFVAAKAVAYGLPRDVALKAVTLYPAQILGVGDRLGSIEPGKDASLIVTDGDVLEAPTRVLRAFLEGREIDLSDRHKRLYERYRLKPRRAAAR